LRRRLNTLGWYLSALGFACLAALACGETSRRPGASPSGTSAGVGADAFSSAGEGFVDALGGKDGSGSVGGASGGVPTGEMPGAAGEPAAAGAGAGVEPSGPLSDQGVLCGDYLSIWRQRQAEREPGEPIPTEGAPAPCFECLRGQEAECGLPDGECSAATSCMERHCLCTPEQPVALSCGADGYPEDLCNCAQSCMPASSTACEEQWRAYMECAVAACREACE
jgi:hypothetical protein